MSGLPGRQYDFLDKLAPKLKPWRLKLIRDMIQDSQLYTDAEIAKAAHYIPRSISTARSNLRCFGSARAPPNGIGR